MFGFSLDLLDQLTFYGSYHRDPVNKAIHLVCVPGIAWSALVWFAACGPLVEGAHLARWLAALGAPQMVAESAVPTPAMLITALYAAYYVALEPIAGTTWVACVGAPMCLTATAFQAWAAPSAWVYALAVHAFCWIAQRPGHVVFERRRPALLDSLFQSLVLAPLFVWMEVMFACGYRPGLHADLKRRVVKRVAAMEEADSKNPPERDRGEETPARDRTRDRPREMGDGKRTNRAPRRAREEKRRKRKRRRKEDETKTKTKARARRLKTKRRRAEERRRRRAEERR